MRRLLPFIACLLLVVPSGRRPASAASVARQWNQQLLDAISRDLATPTIHARNLFHASAAMYDAWSAYDAGSQQIFHHEKIAAADLAAARHEAVSYAAYQLILHRFVDGPAGVGPGRDQTLAAIRQQMVSLGFDPDFSGVTGSTPAALGNRIAQTAIAAGMADGANEQNRYANPPGYEPINQPLTFDWAGTAMVDPNRWQPLHFLGDRTDQFGRPILESTQTSLTPYWGDVKSFALRPEDRGAGGVYHDQGPPPRLFTDSADQFHADAIQLLEFSAQLDPRDDQWIDISPAARGNSSLGSYEQVGYSANPFTGQPYEPQIVKQADYARVIAEFWADGPRSTAPPGHWNEIAGDVADMMDQLGLPKRIGGAGLVVDDLEWDVKQYFALNSALHDAAIAAWNHKGYYDSARPISMIRYLAQLGQSTDPTLTVDLGGGVIKNTYHPDGLPLMPGLIEVITPATTVPGERHAHLAGLEGEIAIRCWQGAIPDIAPFTDPTQISGVGWIGGQWWMPYQLLSFVTPPFPGHVSGHSTFSRAAAEVMAGFTGSEFFPGGLFEYNIPAGSGLDFEYGPTTDVRLQFATYFDAADQAGLSRLYGGIHPPADDLAGRRVGHEVGTAAFALAMSYFNPSGGALAGDFTGDGLVDGGDLLVWQRSFGVIGSDLPADANDDGVVDAADLAVWKQSFQSGAMPSTLTIPERSSALLLTMALLGAYRRCRLSSRRSITGESRQHLA